MKVYGGFIAVLGWFALIAQFYLQINNGLAGTPELIIRYFSYFTILSNILVAVCCTSLLLQPSFGGFFSRPGVQTAITVYIVIVGILYNLLLRSLWQFQGLQWIVNELLHAVIPPLFLVYWLIFTPKDKLDWKDVWPWLIFPLVYIIVILIRGSVSGFYPYPFIDPDKLGFGRVLINSVGVGLAFGMVSLFLVALARSITRRSQKK